MSEISEGVGKFYCEEVASDYVSVDAVGDDLIAIDINDSGDHVSLSKQSARELIKFLTEIVGE